MNILEAIEAIKRWHFVKYDDQSHVMVMFMADIAGVPRAHTISFSLYCSRNKRPEKFADLSPDSFSSLDLDTICGNTFEIISKDEILKQAQEHWDKENKKD